MITEATTQSPTPAPTLKTLESFTVSDDAMAPKLQPGAVVTYELGEFEGDGLYAFYDVKTDRMIARRLERTGDTFAMIAADPLIPPRRMTENDLNDFMAGKVRHYYREE